ncbi:MAG TPA: 3-deoxy-8-phosphooctulonate synthase [Phycisphaeraceae bacterium]
MNVRTLEVGPVRIGPGQPLAIIAGPCVAESLDLCLAIGRALRDRCAELGLGYIFKASFDKANRSSIRSDRGPGLEEGLRLLLEIKDALGVPVTTDIHESHQAGPTAAVADLLQIPAFLCRQTDLLTAAAQTGRPVNVKKGQFLSPREMGQVTQKLTASGAEEAGILLTERGTFFGYHRLVNDFAGLGDLMELGWPVCFDATHSTQQPGQEGTHSGGRPERAPLLARCAIAAGVHAIFLETHPEPRLALSDAATMLPLDTTLDLLEDLARLHRAMESIRPK